MLWLPALAIGALQMLHVQAGALTNWGADFFAPIALYGSLRTSDAIPRWFQPPSPLLSAVIVFAGCLAWEICQRFDFRGTLLATTVGQYDPIDIAAYALAVAVAFGTETLVSRSRQAPGPVEQAPER